MVDERKTILITGGSKGIGKIIATHLALTGYNMILVARDFIKLLQAAKEIQQKNPAITVSYISCDVGNYTSCKTKLSSIPRLDAVINCAAILGPLGPFVDNDIDKWRQTIDINLIGTAHIVHLTLPILLHSRRGKIINFSGGGAAYARAYHSAYGCSKCAVVRFTETVAAEYPAVDINAIAPGVHNTAMWDNETFDKPPEKWADVERLKNLIVFLCSKQSDHISGRLIHIMDNWKKFTPEMPANLFKLRRVEP